MIDKTLKSSFINGPILPEFIADAITKHQSKTGIGAHNIFLGQVRGDIIDANTVIAIDYSAYEEMVEQTIYEIRESAFARYNLSCLHVYHSLGVVKVGEICLFVFVSAPHRNVVFEALEYIVESIKEKTAIFGKECFADDSYRWKINR